MEVVDYFFLYKAQTPQDENTRFKECRIANLGVKNTAVARLCGFCNSIAHSRDFENSNVLNRKASVWFLNVNP